jgi:hypothetical protein
MVEKREPILEGLKKGAGKEKPEENRPETPPPGQDSQGDQTGKEKE